MSTPEGVTVRAVRKDQRSVFSLARRNREPQCHCGHGIEDHEWSTMPDPKACAICTCKAFGERKPPCTYPTIKETPITYPVWRSAAEEAALSLAAQRARQAAIIQRMKERKVLR